MPTFRHAISRSWSVAFAVLRLFARFGIGLLGTYWFVAGVIGALTLPFVGVWGGAAGSVLIAFIGWTLAFGAFKWWPWEALPIPERPAGS